MENLQFIQSNFIYLSMPMILDKGIGGFGVRGGGRGRGGSPRGQVNEISTFLSRGTITDKPVNVNLCSKIFQYIY